MQHQRIISFLGGSAIASAVAIACANAGSLVYTPVSPPFNPNSLSGPTLSAEASAQNFRQNKNNHRQQLFNALTTKQSDQNSVAQNLQDLVLSQVSEKLASTILGAGTNGNPLSGTFQVGSATISYQRNGNIINMTISDGLSTTTIQIPGS
jgi:hypothetical protein